MLVTKRSAGVTLVINLRNQFYASGKARKPEFETRGRRHQKFKKKRGISGTRKRTGFLYEILDNNNNGIHSLKVRK